MGYLKYYLYLCDHRYPTFIRSLDISDHKRSYDAFCHSAISDYNNARHLVHARVCVCVGHSRDFICPCVLIACWYLLTGGGHQGDRRSLTVSAPRAH